MKGGNFIAGYMLPMLLLGVIQSVITFAASFVVSLIANVEINVLGMLAAIVSLIPTMILMVSFGLFFGTLFNEKAAPGLCSIIISLGSFVGSVWFDAEGAGGVLFDICNVLPFYHGVKAARMATALDFSGDFFIHILITAGYAAVVLVLSIVAFRNKMRADLQ